MAGLKWNVLFLVGIVMTGCLADLSNKQFKCAKDSDCPPGQVCNQAQGLCVLKTALKDVFESKMDVQDTIQREDLLYMEVDGVRDIGPGDVHQHEIIGDQAPGDVLSDEVIADTGDAEVPEDLDTSEDEGNHVADVCIPQTCAELGKECGDWDDGCGGKVQCGKCDDSLTCTQDSCDNAGKCQHALGASNCLIDGTCYSSGDVDPSNPCNTCSPTDNQKAWTYLGDGHDLGNGKVCYGGKACKPQTCTDLGKECGIWDDGCGGKTLSCGQCGSGLLCSNYGHCVNHYTAVKIKTNGSIKGGAAAAGFDVYFVGGDKYLYAVKGDDGTLQWKYNLGCLAENTPAYYFGGYVIVACHSGKLIAVQSPNNHPELKWSYSKVSGQISASPAVDYGNVYIGSLDNNLYALKAQDGTLRWKFPTSGSIESSPAVDLNGRVYVGSDDSKLYAINKDGTRIWAFSTGGPVRSSPALIGDPNDPTSYVIYVGSDDKNLYAINAGGTQKWATQLDSKVSAGPAVTASNDGQKTPLRVYVGTENGTLYALDATDGHIVWHKASGQAIEGTPLIIENGNIFVGSDDGTLYAYKDDGSLLWSQALGGKISGSVNAIDALNGHGYLCVPSQDGFLYSIAIPEKAELKSGWPKFHCDRACTGVMQW